MLNERFMCYIKGGSFEGSRYRQACSDATPPLAVKTFEIPYDMYFGNTSGSWQDCGVSFLDVTKKGHALGVAYLINKNQFRHVCAEENGGRAPEEGYSWYEDIIDLGVMDGFEVKTITNRNILPYNEPCLEYKKTLISGIKDNWWDMHLIDINNYLDSCIR